MTHPTIQDRAQRDECCTHCGYPLDLGQRVYVTNGGLGDVYCSKLCQQGYKPDSDGVYRNILGTSCDFSLKR